MQSMLAQIKIPPILLYTTTSGLGDYIVMGDLMRKVETLLPQAKCLIAHRGNPHVCLWPYDNSKERFYNVYAPKELLRLILKLKQARRTNYTVFGLQMAPGSLQGFLFYLFLKKIGALDFIVDFNLINADIITPPKGSYILDLHLNQIRNLFKVAVPKEFYKLSLPLKGDFEVAFPQNSKPIIGIHPWSRRGQLPCFVWPFKKWLEVIKFLLAEGKNKITVFGKDKKFDDFKRFLEQNLGKDFRGIKFHYCHSVQELIENIQYLDLLISVNTSVVHIGYALGKKMIILCGPSLDVWIPKGKNILVVKDEDALFQGADKWVRDGRFGRVERLGIERIIDAIRYYV